MHHDHVLRPGLAPRVRRLSGLPERAPRAPKARRAGGPPHGTPEAGVSARATRATWGGKGCADPGKGDASTIAVAVKQGPSSGAHPVRDGPSSARASPLGPVRSGQSARASPLGPVRSGQSARASPLGPSARASPLGPVRSSQSARVTPLGSADVPLTPGLAPGF